MKKKMLSFALAVTLFGAIATGCSSQSQTGGSDTMATDSTTMTDTTTTTDTAAVVTDTTKADSVK
ncbi:MAG: hypothetical protein EOP46_04645 [Sphingobacteriaceae bacterium]|nr:MAG: hypothetical protein EOP46_04645 [Sphingobacteriaceae bacterium]